MAGGISLATTAPAAILDPLPIITPGKIVHPAPIQQSSSIATGKANWPFEPALTSCVSLVAISESVLQDKDGYHSSDMIYSSKTDYLEGEQKGAKIPTSGGDVRPNHDSITNQDQRRV